MLLGAVVPLCDTRAFLDGLPEKLPAQPGFMHFFGPGGPKALGRQTRERLQWSPTAQVYAAHSALRPHASPLGEVAVERRHDPFHWVLRQFSMDGPVVVRLDVAVLAKDRAVLPLEKKICRIAQGWIGLPVDVPAAERNERVGLQHAGVLLGPVYARATTARRHHGEIRPAWITAGYPCFFVEWSETAETEHFDREELPELVDLAGGLRAGWGEAPSAGPRARILYIAHDGSAVSRGQALALRSRMAAIHAERECLWIILRQIATGRLAPQGKPRPEDTDRVADDSARASASAQSDALQLYLDRSITRLTRIAKDKPSIPDPPPAQEQEVRELRRTGSSFSGALDNELASQNVRGNVRRKAVAWARAESGESAPGPSAAPAPRIGVVLESLPHVRRRAPTLPAGEAQVHSSLAPCGCESVDVGQTVSFLVNLRVGEAAANPGPAGVAGSATVSFDEGVNERRLTAVVTSPHFACPPGEKWDHSFVVRRDAVGDGTWLFRARADGSRPNYSLSVCFFVDAVSVGALTLDLPRRGAGAISPSTGRIALPRPAPSRLTVRITNEASTTRVTWFSPVAGAWSDTCDLTINIDNHLSDLGAPRHQHLDKFRSYCKPFRLCLPQDLVDEIDNDSTPERGLVILSSATLVPFELMPVDRGKTLLGMSRPISRWPIQQQRASVGPSAGDLQVQKVGCIRPIYTKSPLPSAAAEEKDLEERFGPLALANNRAQLDALLAQSDVDLLHFAGHAQHNPALLKFGDAEEALAPDAFYGAELTERAPAPFFFVNGCEAGLARSGMLPTLGNMMEVLIKCKFAGAIAPLIMVDSAAARDAAQVFYTASSEGKSVGEAVQAIHALAEQQPERAGTFLSYVAYAPPDLHLRFRPRSG